MSCGFGEKLNTFFADLENYLMNVLINCLSALSGGAVSYLHNLVPLLTRQFEESPENHSLRILAHESQRELLGDVPDSQCVWTRGARPTGWRRILWERRNITRIARETNADVLFTPYQIGPCVEGLKQVLMLRNMEPFFSNRYRYSLSSFIRNYFLLRASIRVLRMASRVIAVSEFARNHLIHKIGIDTERIWTIYHGYGQSVSWDSKKDCEILIRIGVENDYVLTCGSLLPYRRCEDVIAAFNRCAIGLETCIKLVIAGNGTDHRYDKMIRKAIASSPFRKRIRYLGHVPSEIMAALYRKCFVFVMASEIEACPNIAIEAMASGCAIVSADQPPLPEMFQGASLEYEARDINHLVEQIHRCIDHEDLRRKMKIRAIKRAEAFSWEKCARETYAALTEWPEGKA